MERQAKSALITVRTRQVVVMAYTLKEPEVACKDCGIIFTRKSHKTIRCPECRRQYVLKRERECSRERYAGLKGTSDTSMPREGVKASICDKKTCARCKYSTLLSGTLACGYILNTGHRRGCPAGQGCSKRELGTI